jgi:RNA recognition motif-containing protein
VFKVKHLVRKVGRSNNKHVVVKRGAINRKHSVVVKNSGFDNLSVQITTPRGMTNKKHTVINRIKETLKKPLYPTKIVVPRRNNDIQTLPHTAHFSELVASVGVSPHMVSEFTLPITEFHIVSEQGFSNKKPYSKLVFTNATGFNISRNFPNPRKVHISIPDLFLDNSFIVQNPYVSVTINEPHNTTGPNATVSFGLQAGAPKGVVIPHELLQIKHPHITLLNFITMS